jgi:hypothetical protein
MRVADSEVSTVATCNVLHYYLLPAGSTLEEMLESPGEKGDVEMHIALGISFGMIVAAPFVGRWRANVWLRKHTSGEQTIKSIPEIA